MACDSEICLLLSVIVDTIVDMKNASPKGLYAILFSLLFDSAAASVEERGSSDQLNHFKITKYFHINEINPVIWER